MNSKTYRACLFVDEVGGTPSEGFQLPLLAYPIMEDWLHTYLGKFRVERDVRPFQLSYRPFDVYLVDIGGYPSGTKHTFMTQLGNVVASRPSRLYLFWTGETWEAFEVINPDLADYDNCVNCCNCDLEKIERLLLDI